MGHGEPAKDDPNEVALQFDLRKPIPAQIAEAKMYLIDRQRAQIGKKVQYKKITDNWLRDLRVLDAKASGASWSEIAQALSRPDQADHDWVRKAHAAAVSLTLEFKL